MAYNFAFLVLFFSATDLPRLPVIRDAPSFTLIDQDERPRKLGDYRGKVMLVSFVFTTCSGTCPATTHRLARIFHEVEKKDWKKRVQFLSITLDPERDKPETLRNYQRLYDIESPAWAHLTGPVENVNAETAKWGMWAKPSANGQLDHPSRVFLVDTRGRIREIYNLDFLRLPWVLEDIEDLLGER